MLSSFKVYFYAFLSILTLGIFTYIKHLREQNANQEKDINTLKSNIEVQEQIHKDDIVREKFNTKQEINAKKVSDESDLDKLEKEINHDKINDDFTAITA